MALLQNAFFLSDNATPWSSISNLNNIILFDDRETYDGSPASPYSTENIPISEKTKGKLSYDISGGNRKYLRDMRRNQKISPPCEKTTEFIL